MELILETAEQTWADLHMCPLPYTDFNLLFWSSESTEDILPMKPSSQGPDVVLEGGMLPFLHFSLTLAPCEPESTYTILKNWGWIKGYL